MSLFPLLSHSLSPAGLSVSFNDSVYSVLEDSGSVQLCVDLQGSSAVNVTVILNANEDILLPINMRASGKKFMLELFLK